MRCGPPSGWSKKEFGRRSNVKERRQRKKQDEKRYRDNAKEKRRKKAEAAQAEEWAFESMQRCLVEGQEALLESMKYEARPTTIKAAAEGEIVEATVNGYFVAAKEAGRGKSDDAEAAWVEREEEVARVKARLAKMTQDIEDSQRYIFDFVQGMDRECMEKEIEKERRRIEE